MESKIMIDITPMGAPFIYIDYKQSDDLRDKILGRFLYESGALEVGPKLQLPNPTPVHLHVLWNSGEGHVQAMVEIPNYGEPRGGQDVKQPVSPQQNTDVFGSTKK